MAIVSDLTGLGLAPALAGKLGHQSANPVVGAGIVQAGATPIGTSVTVAAPVTGQTAYTLPAKSRSPEMLKEFYFFNVGAVPALVYPPLDGSTLNGSTAADLAVPAGKSAMFMLVKGSGGPAPQWVSILSA